MSTVFVALQCCQCSTMQVKQRKKSSNKWTCVVCNQKQSARHVFAQGSMARDVRSFVQSFNMSRQFADQNRNQTLDEALEEEEDYQEPRSNQINNNTKKKRTDWSEYIDPVVDDREQAIEDEFDGVNGPMIVTELPKALFRRPKLSMDTGELCRNNGGKGFKPVFSRRKSINTSVNRDKEPSKCQPTTVGNDASMWNYCDFEEKEPTLNLSTISKRAYQSRTCAIQETENNNSESRHFHSTTNTVLSKWSNNMVQDKAEDISEKLPWKCQAKTMKGGSKWDDYITEEDDVFPLENRREITKRARRSDDVTFGVTLHDERVEDDVHPDFQ